MVILNSPQLLSKKYLSWRILRSPGDWARAYIDRAKELRGYKSAIIFPEQVLPITGCGLYEVHFGSNNATNDSKRQTTEVRVNIVKRSNCRITLGSDKGQPTVEDIYEYEHANQNGSDINTVYLGMGAGMQPFLERNLFSAKRDALAFAKKQLSRICD